MGSRAICAGLERVKAYLTRFGKNWTMNFTAIGIHYLGLEELREAKGGPGLERLQRAFDYNPLESTATSSPRSRASARR